MDVTCGKGEILGKGGKEFTVIREMFSLRSKEFDWRGVLLVSHPKNVFDDFLRVIGEKKFSDPGNLCQ